MDPKILYQIAQSLPQGIAIRDLPELAKQKADSVQADDLAKGLLAPYLSSLAGDKFNFNMGGIEYNPNDDTSYTMDYKDGGIQIGGKWKF
tara:strand:+ start:191 stop:460 length:270 start_codon:yes stop_codon:yes gene_type:complete